MTSSQDNWQIVGWISATKKQTKKGVLCSVKDSQNRLIGWVLGDTLHRMLNGEVKGVPIKITSK